MRKPSAPALAVVALVLGACQINGGAGVATFRAEVPAATQASIAGTYDGLLPCADCSGLRTVLTLAADGSYRLEETYEGKVRKPFVTTGRYRFDAARARVTLDKAADGRMVEIAGERAYVLNADGTRVTDGPFADAFTLFRKP